jgi:hypothetical protein
MVPSGSRPLVAETANIVAELAMRVQDTPWQHFWRNRKTREPFVAVDR